MNHLIDFNKYSESVYIDLSISNEVIDVFESMGVWEDALIKSIGAEKIDIFKELKLPKDKFLNNLDIDYLSNSTEFINSLSSLGLKKSTIQNTDDYETYIEGTCKFMMLYDINSNELETPKFLLIQYWNDLLNRWNACDLFKVNGEIKYFYDKLSSKTIEISDGGEKYIYSTSNGNDWELQNLDNKKDEYPRFLSKDKLKKIFKNGKIIVNII